MMSKRFAITGFPLNGNLVLSRSLGFPSVRSYNRFVNVKPSPSTVSHIQFAVAQFFGPPSQIGARLGQLAEERVLDPPTAAVVGNILRKVSDLCLNLDALPFPYHSKISVTLYCAGRLRMKTLDKGCVILEEI
jgi:hypothetical protein